MKHKVLLSILIISFVVVGFSFVGKAQAFSLNDLERLQSTVQSLKAEIASLKSQLTAQLRLSEPLRFEESIVDEGTYVAPGSTFPAPEQDVSVIETEIDVSVLEQYKDWSFFQFYKLSSSTICKIQDALKALGYNPDKRDCVWGWNTWSAYQEWKKDQAQAAAPTPTTSLATLTVVKDTVPNDPQNFAFTVTCVKGSGICSKPQSFTLDDDPNSSTPKSKTVKLGSATYIIEEISVPGWSTKIECSTSLVGQPNQSVSGNNIAVDLGGPSATRCTFTNTKEGLPSPTPIPAEHTHLINYSAGTALMERPTSVDPSLTSFGYQNDKAYIGAIATCPSGKWPLGGGYFVNTKDEGKSTASIGPLFSGTLLGGKPGYQVIFYDPKGIILEGKKGQFYPSQVFVTCAELEKAVDQTAKPHYHP